MSETAVIKECVLAVCISKTYKSGMNADDLYECTRGVWKLDPKRAATAQYVFAVYKGEIVGVFEFTRWDPAGTTPYSNRKFTEEGLKDRYEFMGNEIPSSYVGKRLPNTMRGPYRFYNC